ncbi:MAG: PilZ domain-containing protein [Anaeromyxobacteraceae bacterium]
MKQRGSPRHRRRLRARLEGVTAAFTVDVGAGGFCMLLNRIISPGTPLTGSLHVDGAEVPFEGRVAWVKPGDSRLRIPSRVGVSFSGSRREFDGTATSLGA